MTNAEIKSICKDMQAKHCTVDYNFVIKQKDNIIKIYWEYLQGSTNDKSTDCWTIKILPEDNFYMVYNEHGEFMNEFLEDDLDLKSTIQSAVYYMTTRY